MFDWDDANEEHIAHHGVARWEAEEALSDPDRVTLRRKLVRGELRYTVVGSTTSGRVLVVVYIHRERRLRVVTARPPSAAERRQYRRK